MTGAPMPDGADAIVMVERTERDPDRGDGDGVLITLAVDAGLHVRRAGGDLEAGDVVFEPGTVLTAARIGVLATVGARRVRVHPRARVGVLSTGDELVDSHRARSATPTDRCCSRNSPTRAPRRSISGPRTTTPTS